MFELIAGYEAYVGTALVLLCCYLAWRNGHENGVMKGCDATLTLLHMNKAIRIVEDQNGEQHIMMPDGNTPITLDVEPKKS